MFKHQFSIARLAAIEVETDAPEANTPDPWDTGTPPPGDTDAPLTWMDDRGETDACESRRGVAPPRRAEPPPDDDEVPDPVERLRTVVASLMAEQDPTTRSAACADLVDDVEFLDDLATESQSRRREVDLALTRLATTRGLGRIATDLRRLILARAPRHTAPPPPRSGPVPRSPETNAAAPRATLPPPPPLSILLESVLGELDLPAGLRCPAGWLVDPDGIHRVGMAEDGTEIKKSVTSTPSVLLGRRTDVDDGSVVLEAAFLKRGRWKRIHQPRDVFLNGRKLVDLARADYPVNSNNAGTLVSFHAVFEEINLPVLREGWATRHLGWQGAGGKHGFLWGTDCLPGTDGGASGDVRLVGDGEYGAEVRGYCAAGTWEGWLDAITLIRGRPMAWLALLAGLGTPLLEFLPMLANFALDLAGESSRGKTTAIRVPGSVWGNPDERAADVVQTWRNTRVFIERAAVLRNGLPLILDESKTADPATVAALIYEIVTGRSKGRGSPTGIQATQHYRTICLTTGEERLTSFTQDGGTRARVLSFFGAPLGPPTPENGQLADALRAGLFANYGHAGPRMVHLLTSDAALRASLPGRFQERCAHWAGQIGGGGVALRSSAYVAFLDLVQEIAVDRLGLPTPEGQPLLLALEAAIHAGAEADRPLAALQYALAWAAGQQGRFWGRHDVSAAGELRRPSAGWAGAWGERATHPAFLPNVLQQLLTAAGYGFDATMEVWKARGWLAAEKERRTRRVHVEFERLPCYALTDAAQAAAGSGPLADPVADEHGSDPE